MIANVLWIELVMTITVDLLVKMLVVKMLNVRLEIMEQYVLVRLGTWGIHLQLVVQPEGLRLMLLDSQDSRDILILISYYSLRSDFFGGCLFFLSREIHFRVQIEFYKYKLKSLKI